MAIHKAAVNNEILRWARESTGLSLAIAAEKAGITGVKDLTPAERLQTWEEGDDRPTPNQLKQLAKAYVRPVLTFYMKTPPQPTQGLGDFRTVGDRPPEESAKLRRLVATIKARQDEVVEILQDEDEQPQPLAFIGRFSVKDDPQAVVQDIHSHIGVPERVRRGRDERFRFLRRRIEELGIFVLLQGDLGSSHSDIEADEFRGFVLAHPFAPFIVLNDNDAKAAMMFTLIHELAHLWIGESGISNTNPFVSADDHDNEIEQFCNKVASEYLLPTHVLNRQWEQFKNGGARWAIEEIADLSAVSRAAVAFRLNKLGVLADADWWAFYREYQGQWRENRDRLRNRPEARGPSHAQIKRYQLGGNLVRTVLGAVDSGSLSYMRASRILGTTFKNFDKLRAGGQ